MDNNQIQLFENKKIRSVWDVEQEEWYFSIIDVVKHLQKVSILSNMLKK